MKTLLNNDMFMSRTCKKRKKHKEKHAKEPQRKASEALFLEYKSLKKKSCFYPELGHWQASP